MKFIVGTPLSKGVGFEFSKNFLKKGGLDFSYEEIEVGVGFVLKREVYHLFSH